MRGIIVAAGQGSRMGHLTESKPKCLLPIAGRSLLDWTMERLRAAGCREIVIIVGYQGELIRPEGVRIVENRDYKDNNILHSLMTARDYLDGPVMVSYSDIWVEPHIHKQLAAAEGDIAIAVDEDWQPYYEGRTLHPLGEAEKVLFDGAHRGFAFGKHLEATKPGFATGEFLGLWRMSERGTRQFREAFLEIDARVAPGAPFRNAKVWKKAYITDLFQELADQGVPIACSLVARGWAELDTGEDYGRLVRIAGRQGLHSLQRELGR